MGEKTDYLLDHCVIYDKMLCEIAVENGLEGSKSRLYRHFNGAPEFQLTIERLLKQIDKQDKWLKKRKEEVTVLTNAITECNKRKEFYKSAAADSKRVK
jgi:hypothetical protein